MSEYERGRNYKDWIEAVVRVSQEAPSSDLHKKWAAISAVAGALGRKCWYTFGTYRVNPNLFIVLLGEPSTGKGVAMALPYNLVFRRLSVFLNVQNDTSPGWSDVWKTYGLKTPFRLAADRITPEKIGEDMATNLGDIRLDLSTDSERFHDSSVSILTPEFGTFMRRTFDGLPVFMTDMWDFRDDYSHSTITRNAKIIKGPCLNWLAGCVPIEFARNLPENAKDQGLLSRIIPVLYDGDGFPKRFKTKSYHPDEIEFLRFDLAQIGNIQGEFDWESPTLLNEAEAWEIKSGDALKSEPKLQWYRERRKGHIMKVAMCVSAARSDSRLITERDWETTKELFLEIESKMPAALATFGMTEVGHMTRDLEVLLRSNPNGMPVSAFKRHILRTARTVSEMSGTVDALTQSGIIRIVGNVVKLGRRE